MKSRLTCILILLGLISLVLAATPTSFCKCTCFTNSTIIPLSLPQSSPDHSTDPGSGTGSKRTGTCTDCNRQFCLDYNLPICKGAKEDDVFTTCFQRDSAKDQTIVLIFLGITAGLLIWAGIKPWVNGWMEKARGRHNYAPVGGEGN